MSYNNDYIKPKEKQGMVAELMNEDSIQPVILYLFTCIKINLGQLK